MSQESLYVGLGEQRYRVDRFWGSLPEDTQLGRVSTLAVAADGAVLVAQRSGPAVMVFNRDGTLRGSWGDDLADPHGINVDGAGRCGIRPTASPVTATAWSTSPR